jgi:exosortase
VLLVAGLAATVGLYFGVFQWLVETWGSNSDFFHGFFIPFFVGYLLWSNRRRLQQSIDGGPWDGFVLGLSLASAGLLLRLGGIFMRMQTLEGLSLLPFLLGVFVLCFGRSAVCWSATAVAMLVFMIPLPGFLSGQLSGLLQSLATMVSTFALQTIGIPAFAEGNIITLSQGQIGVAEACSGLRMLYSFFALTSGACLLIDRTTIEKIIIAASAIPIAIIANCLRIIATGIAFEYADQDTARKLFHDVGGWMMMPLGFLILMLLLAFLDRSLAVEDRPLRMDNG